MKKIGFLILFMFFILSSAFSQAPGNITFIHEITNKDIATFGDAVKIFTLIVNNKSESFNKDVEFLIGKGMLEEVEYNKDAPIRKGELSLMIAKYFDLGDSLMYMIFKTPRYAFRTCVANGIMNFQASEWDYIDGGELIEIMYKVSKLFGGEE
ncbi:MAG: hypothetical protein SVR08_07535 [Spirochaetota bacterium]|nr:hypothetical protein [Spirochaetota bacterium]